jgi:hypothetical protein
MWTVFVMSNTTIFCIQDMDPLYIPSSMLDDADTDADTDATGATDAVAATATATGATATATGATDAAATDAADALDMLLQSLLATGCVGDDTEGINTMFAEAVEGEGYLFAEGTGAVNDALFSEGIEGTGAVNDALFSEGIEGTGAVNDALFSEGIEGTESVDVDSEETDSMDVVGNKRRRVYGTGRGSGRGVNRVAPFTNRVELIKHHDALTRKWLVGEAPVGCTISNLRCVPFVTRGAGVERVTTSHFNVMKLLHILNRTHQIDMEGLVKDLSRVDILGCFFHENGVRCKAMSTHTSFYCGIHSVEEVSDSRYHASVEHVAKLLTASKIQ